MGPQPMVNTTVPDNDLSQWLLLKRWFLRTMVVSLVICALIAVVLLLVGTFNQTTARILGTLAALAVHCGVAMACAESIERQRWGRLSQIALIIFAGNFALLIAAIWWPSGWDDGVPRTILSTLVLMGYYVVAVPCADLFERRVLRPLAGAGLAAVIIGCVMLLTCIWASETDSELFVRLTAVAAIAAGSFAHTCLLVRVPAARTMGQILAATLGCVWSVALLGSFMILAKVEHEWAWRMLGALAVLDATGTLSLLILARLRKVDDVERLETTPARLELRCPRCTRSQTVAAGASHCTACGLKFRIEIDEPRCAKCDYLLWNLPERRCPECGTPF